MNAWPTRWLSAAGFAAAGAIAGTALFAFAQGSPSGAEMPSAVERRLEAIEKDLAAIQARMGRSSLPATSANTFERRLDDDARRLAKLERDLKRIEDRIRQLEAARR